MHKKQTCSFHLQAALHSKVLAKGNNEAKLQAPHSAFSAEYYSTSELLQTLPPITLPFTFQVHSLRAGDSKGGGWGGNINVDFSWNSAGTNHPEHSSKEKNRTQGLHFWPISPWCCRLCVLAGESVWSNQENRDPCKFAYRKISSCLNREKKYVFFLHFPKKKIFCALRLHFKWDSHFATFLQTAPEEHLRLDKFSSNSLVCVDRWWTI